MLVCLFDIDGTLVHTGGAGTGALACAMTRGFGIAPPIAQVKVHGRTDRAICRDLFAAHGVEHTEQNWTRFRTAYLESLPELLAARPGTVLPGVVSLLSELQRRPEVKLGLLTGNTRAGAEIKLRYYGLNDYFDCGGFGDLHHDRDDVARAALASAREKHGDEISLERVWVIGDTPADVQCGRAIGARVVAVATGQHSVNELRQSAPDHTVENLANPADWKTFWG